jgi:selenocysteine lyase/cysteine desulfurase
MRFCRGNPNHAGAYVLADTLAYLSRHPGLEAHVLALAGELRARCLAAGLPVMTPANHGASVCLPHPHAAEAVAAMARAGALVWNGRGRIRVSFHGYNGAADLDRAMEALGAVFATAARP